MKATKLDVSTFEFEVTGDEFRLILNAARELFHGSPQPRSDEVLARLGVSSKELARFVGDLKHGFDTTGLEL